MEIDYKFCCGWIKPSSGILVCGFAGHLDALHDEGILSHRDAERKGYIKVDSAEISWGRKPTGRQVKVVVNLLTERNYKLTNIDKYALTLEVGFIGQLDVKGLLA